MKTRSLSVVKRRAVEERWEKQQNKNKIISKLDNARQCRESKIKQKKSSEKLQPKMKDATTQTLKQEKPKMRNKAVQTISKGYFHYINFLNFFIYYIRFQGGIRAI